MIQIEPCRGCGRTLYTGKVANLDVRCEVEPLDAQEAIAALIAGRELWRATPTGLTPAGSAVLGALKLRGNTLGPTVVGTHTCKALNGRLPASQKVGGPVPPKAPADRPVAPSVASLGPSTVHSGVPDAVSPPSRAPGGTVEPLCDTCRQPCTPGTYWGFQHGTTWVHAEHVTCP
jgi:hypothetical protein